MEPFDRDNAYGARHAATMLAVTLQQRAENDEQRTRMRVLRDANDALRRRARLDEHGADLGAG
jgi:cell division protein FtsB